MDIDNGYTTAKDFYENKIKKLETQNEIIKKLLIKSKQFIYHLKDCASHSYDDCDCGSEEAEIEIHKILKELKEV